MNSSASHVRLMPDDVLHGLGVYLRPPKAGEMAFVRRLWTDPDTMAPVGGIVDLSDSRAAQWYARMVDPGRDSDCYCLIFLSDDTPVGEVSFHRWEPAARRAELNIKVLAARRGQGIARDALRAFLGYFFGRFGGRTMIDDVAPDNGAGLRFIRQFGFEAAGYIPGAHRFALTREVFLALYGPPDSAPEQR